MEGRTGERPVFGLRRVFRYRAGISRPPRPRSCRRPRAASGAGRTLRRRAGEWDHRAQDRRHRDAGAVLRYEAATRSEVLRHDPAAVRGVPGDRGSPARPGAAAGTRRDGAGSRDGAAPREGAHQSAPVAGLPGPDRRSSGQWMTR